MRARSQQPINFFFSVSTCSPTLKCLCVTNEKRPEQQQLFHQIQLESLSLNGDAHQRRGKKITDKTSSSSIFCDVVLGSSRTRVQEACQERERRTPWQDSACRDTNQRGETCAREVCKSPWARSTCHIQLWQLAGARSHARSSKQFWSFKAAWLYNAWMHAFRRYLLNKWQTDSWQNTYSDWLQLTSLIL